MFREAMGCLKLSSQWESIRASALTSKKDSVPTLRVVFSGNTLHSGCISLTTAGVEVVLDRRTIILSRLT